MANREEVIPLNDGFRLAPLDGVLMQQRVPIATYSDEVIAAHLEYCEAVYALGKTDKMPSWEELKPRVEKRLRYVLNGPKEAL